MQPRRVALRHSVVVAADVEVLLPGGGDVLVVQVHGAVGLGEHERPVGVSAAHRDEAAGEHAVELARQVGQQLQRLAVHGTRRAAQDLRVDVRRGESLGNDDHLRAVLAMGVADQVLDAREVLLDLSELEGRLDDGDPGHAETSAAEVVTCSGAACDIGSAVRTEAG